jgi:hypothetical protein
MNHIKKIDFIIFLFKILQYLYLNSEMLIVPEKRKRQTKQKLNLYKPEKVNLCFRQDGTYDSDHTITDEDNSYNINYDKREKNRLSAIQARKKRKQIQEEQLKKITDLETQNLKLKKEMVQLKKRIILLEKELSNEKDFLIESYLSGILS